MKREYDFSQMKGVKNPYAKFLKKQITIRIAVNTIAYFKTLASQTGIPYQNIIDLYLAECAQKHRRLSMKWA